MNDLHAVFRASRSGDYWEAYSRPVSIYAGGATFEQARDEFTRAAEFFFDSEWLEVNLVTHVEHEIMAGLYSRVALDRYHAERERTVEVLRASLTMPSQLEHLRSAVTTYAATGDTVFVSCIASDPLDWVVDQIARTDVLQVCSSVGDNAVWWTTLASPKSDYLNDDSETLAEAGLSVDSSTVGDLMLSEGRYKSTDYDNASSVMTGGSRTLVVSR